MGEARGDHHFQWKANAEDLMQSVGSLTPKSQALTLVLRLNCGSILGRSDESHADPVRSAIRAASTSRRLRSLRAMWKDRPATLRSQAEVRLLLRSLKVGR